MKEPSENVISIYNLKHNRIFIIIDTSFLDIDIILLIIFILTLSTFSISKLKSTMVLVCRTFVQLPEKRVIECIIKIQETLFFFCRTSWPSTS